MFQLLKFLYLILKYARESEKGYYWNKNIKIKKKLVKLTILKILNVLISFTFVGLCACNDKKESESFSTAGVKNISGNKMADVKYSLEQLNNTRWLSNSSVNCIFHDSENLIWIGSWDGRSRYNANDFKIFRPELSNEASLSNQVILKIERW